MTPKLAIPLIVALGASTAVFAQDMTADPDTDFGATSIPFEWDDETRNAFFSDPETSGLLGDDEITENWANLTLEQQDIVLAHCDGIDANGNGFDDAQEVPSGDDTAPGTDDALADPETDTFDDPETDTDLGAADDMGATGDDPDIAHLCALIEDQ
ncbi:hypothetical protein [Roseinatronobacter sp. S2]|uniref:hypothetical protein n=1 Tax=Roseinatronobacter sp. S2 TaxID=3035471 RepID=UPI00240F05D5|nr:hypothetical protein [Roseinatronobacter sp. S2]WFE76573.1 hypothetical protein P8S53_18820 [Roseinatronobacter sp. S2]